MKTFLFFLTDGSIILQNAKNIQGAYNHLVKMGLLSTTAEISSAHLAVTNGSIDVFSDDIKFLIEEWQFTEFQELSQN